MQVPFFAGMVKLMPYIIWKLTRPSDRQNNFVKMCYFKKITKWEEPNILISKLTTKL